MAAPKLPPAIDSKSTLSPDAEAFINDRKYLRGVSAKTLSWYQSSFIAFHGCETKVEYVARIRALQEREVKPVSINTWLRCINAFQHWRATGETDKKCHPGCTHLKFPKLKVASRILSTFNTEQQKRVLASRSEWVKIATGRQKFLLNSNISNGASMERAQVLCALLLDTGVRIDEALTLTGSAVDLESLLITVVGKGNKQRRVPISLQGRKWLYQWIRTHHVGADDFVFATTAGTSLSIRNAQRDIAQLCKAAGVEGVRCSPHTFRHTFAVNYLRNGGNLEYLRRILGHTSINITQVYLRSLGTEDLQNVHTSLSPLSKL